MGLPELICPKCHRIYPLSLFTKNCDQCGSTLLVDYDYKAAQEPLHNIRKSANYPGIWKFHPLLPLDSVQQVISLGEGGTFLQRCDRLARECGVRRLYLKNETTNPTGSFMDRGVAVELSEAASLGVRSVQCAPTGNLGASLAGYAARAGMRCILYVSSDINPGKLLQMVAYDAEVKVGSPPSPLEKSEKSLWVTPVDPYILEGEKTIIFEVCEQLGWRTPSRIIAPVGTGGLFSMLWKGLRELSQTRLIEDGEPRLTSVQAEGCDPIVTAFEGHYEKVKPATHVDTLAVDLKVPSPPLGEMVLEAIRASHGSAVAVSDEEILEATRLLAKTEGVFAEPAAASTVAALRKMVEERTIDPWEEAVCVITGAGLKDPSATLRLLDRHRRIKFLVERRGRGLLNSLGGTKIKILRLLEGGEAYGYGIWRALDERYGVQVKIPSVYQHLSELEALGLIEKGRSLEVRGKPTRQCFVLTAKGRETLNTLARLGADESKP